MEDEVKFQTLALNIKFYLNVFDAEPIGIIDLYAVLT